MSENKVQRRNSMQTHGLSRHPLYKIWSGIRYRCTNPDSHDYGNYGARGIDMFTLWLDNPEAFITWVEANLGPRPAGQSLDRVDNNGHYEPGNLRWATQSEQVRNRRFVTALTEVEEQVILAMRAGTLDYPTLQSILGL